MIDDAQEKGADNGRHPFSMSREDYIEAGLGKFLIESSTHPGYHASIWPIRGSGLNTLGANQSRYRLPHLNYNSVLITVISNDWHEGGWWRLQNMIRRTEELGYTVALEEVDDMSTMPADAIGVMRANASMLALDGGFEWCFMIDTDVYLEEDTLARLLIHDIPVVYPLVVANNDEFPGGALQSPILKEGAGLQPVTWGTMCAMLFNTKVFNCLSPYAWHGHDYHFAQNLAHYGHRIYVDTDTVVHATRGPARHPSQTWEDLWGRLRQAYERRQIQPRHRGPPPGFDPAFDPGFIDEEGVYWGVKVWERTGAIGPNVRLPKHA